MSSNLRNMALAAALFGLGDGRPDTAIRRDRDGDPQLIRTQKYLAHGGRKFDPAKRRAKNKAAELSRKRNRT